MTHAYTPQSHRLLFRGSLSVTDSRLLLEGLSFTLPIDNTRSPSVNLLQNPLALALESMRGRTLALCGTSRVDAVHLDKTAEVDIDIHPSAFITRLYFENLLCSAPITSPLSQTDIGIRVTLGDPDSQDASDILIYGQLPEADHFTRSSSASPNKLPTLELRAARILVVPAVLQPRPPRPDDPSPRFPPVLVYTKKRRAEESPSTKLKRRKDEAVLQNARDVMTRMPSADVIGGTNRPKLFSRAKTVQDDVFKVPSLPDLKGKDKVSDISKELEKANKTVVKRAASDCLAKYGIHKVDAEFKEIWGFIYRGTEFALRAHMQSRAIESRTAEKFAKVHAEMYIKGTISISSVGEVVVSGKDVVEVA
ncbi:hypothetical protein B0F90DRAFT_1667516 [Multifurca ochricompacta]|uniref:Sld7 C-terminal domain-containing protein n=1 Tax=Multifurca ochricompacta TaxID=376703 RepID=A0AAD4QLK7_9AGAM|nr:hypothetical protein B0F90DRAFT_1667516 [Multifurca ochricompacta]